jgi:hypothetical protein
MTDRCRGAFKAVRPANDNAPPVSAAYSGDGLIVGVDVGAGDRLAVVVARRTETGAMAIDTIAYGAEALALIFDLPSTENF